MESRCHGFLSSEKNALESRCCGLFVSVSRGVLVPEFQCRGFLVLESRCPGFSILESRSFVYVPPRHRFRYHREIKKITHNYVNYVIEKYFNGPNLYNIDLHNVCISELE